MIRAQDLMKSEKESKLNFKMSGFIVVSCH